MNSLYARYHVRFFFVLLRVISWIIFCCGLEATTKCQYDPRNHTKSRATNSHERKHETSISKNQLQLGKQRIQRFPRADYIGLTEISDIRRTVARTVRKNVAKPTSGLQR